MSDVAPLDPGLCRELVRRALAEDLGWGDVTTDALVDGACRVRACLAASREVVLAGIALAEEAFRQLDPLVSVDRRVDDGTTVGNGEVVLEVSGSAGAILTAERTARNFLSRLTGIATLTRRCVTLARGCAVRSSRDTTPGLRALEHYAVRVGGGGPYRSALDAGVVARAAHVRLVPDVATAVGRMAALQSDLPTAIEVRSLADIDEAMAAGARRVVFGPAWGPTLPEGVARIAGRAPVDVVVTDADALAALPAGTLQHVACVIVAGLTSSAVPPPFHVAVEPISAGGA